MWWWINPGGFWERRGDRSQDRIIGSSALYNKQRGIQWQINGPPRLLRHLLLYKAWSTGGPFTGMMWPLKAAASIHWLRLTGQCQKKTHELKEGTRSGSGPRGATLHQSVNSQSWRLTQGKDEFQTRESPALEVQHHVCLPSAAMASLKQLQCDTKAWQGSSSARFALLHTCMQTRWWQLLINEEVTDSITRRVFKNRRDLILQQRPPRPKKI